jgi:hypothetical protein
MSPYSAAPTSQVRAFAILLLIAIKQNAPSRKATSSKTKNNDIKGPGIEKAPS